MYKPKEVTLKNSRMGIASGARTNNHVTTKFFSARWIIKFCKEWSYARATLARRSFAIKSFRASDSTYQILSDTEQR